jgi:selenide,water dikinase
MLTSNGPAAERAVEQGVRAMTDVTGFGLAGHLLEMLRASNVSAELNLATIPLLPGAGELFARGIESTLAPSNRQSEAEIAAPDTVRRSPTYAALFDPQTSGGLMIGVPATRAAALIAGLAQESAWRPVVIGEVRAHDGVQPRVRIAASSRT